MCMYVCTASYFTTNVLIILSETPPVFFCV